MGIYVVGMLFVSAKSEQCREYHITLLQGYANIALFGYNMSEIVFGVFEWNITYIYINVYKACFFAEYFNYELDALLALEN